MESSSIAMLTNDTATLLVVDDSIENLHLLNGMLTPQYQVLAAKSGESALEIVSGPIRPDLVLLDVMMPILDGYQVFERLRADPTTCDIPVIFLTALDSPEAELRGLEAGAVDYITKPIMPPILMARVRTQLELKRARDLLADHNTRLEAEVQQRMQENEVIQEAGIRALAHLAETRDNETGYHILRTQAYVRELALRLRGHPRFAPTLTPRYIDLLHRSAPLHDIGKVGVPDSILRKPGPLTAEEWVVMKTHAVQGAQAIELAERDTGRKIEFLSLAKEIAHWHHEKWDGSGYPDGLAGEAIPLSARLMAVADVFDALVSPRVYKPAMPCEAARDIIDRERGRHFDPDVADAVLEGFETFLGISHEHCDA
jgi:putative two-component system response regulator